MKTTQMMIMVLICLVWASAASALDVNLQWDANLESDLAGYKVYYGVNGLSNPISVDVNNLTVATIYGLDPSQNYAFAVAAYNTSGLEGPYSNVITAIESIPPVVSITNLINNAKVSNTVQVLVSATDNAGVVKVEYYVNDTLKASDTAEPYQYSWDTLAGIPGLNTITAKAYDAAGNVGFSTVTVDVVNDVTPPTISYIAPLQGSILNGTIAVSCNAADDVGVIKIEFYVNGTMVAALNTTPYSYLWDTKSVANGSYTLTAKAYDAANHVTTSTPVIVTVNNTVPDTTVPVVSSFSMPATTTSMTVAITSFAVTDNVGVTGYLITESATAPAAAGWTATAQTSFTFSAAGSKIAYAWAKDAAGNVSLSRSAAVTITLPDTSAPVVSAFILPTTASTLTVAISNLTATDNVGVAGYRVTESSSVPAAGAAGWTASTPISFTFTSAGSKTAYAWAKDAAGNVSASRSAIVTITLPDTTAPVVSAFTMPATATSLTVAVPLLTATDAVGVTGYLITESAAKPAAGASGWTVSAPTSFIFSAAGSKTAYAWAKDAAGSVSSSRSAVVTITLPDTTAPVVSAFTMPATATSLTVAVPTLTATDAVGVTGYLITESAAKPAAGASGWTASAPTSFIFSVAGSKTAYAWAKDAAGNVSSSRSAVVTITLPDMTAPVVSAFTMPATATSLTVAVPTLTATDAVGVTGYLITESAVKPAANAAGWTASTPTSFTFTSAGSKTAYAWAKDAAGNVSSIRSATVNITLPDTTVPVVSTFTMPATATSLTVAVPLLTATDAVGVTGYLITESAAKPAAGASGWIASAPTSFIFSAAGSKTAYAWAKDAAGNVSASRSATVTITLPDTTAPVVSSFTMKATASSKIVTISSFTATDNISVTGYLITESATSPAASASGWTASAPTSYTFSTVSNKTAFAWVKDAAGNVSASLPAFVSFSTLQAAYDSAAVASGSVQLAATGTIPANTGVVPEFIANSGKDVVISGGFNASNQTRSGVSVVTGAMIIKSGKVISDGVALRNL